MARNARKSSGTTKKKNWRDLHHRLDFTLAEEQELVEWCKRAEFDLVKHLQIVLDRQWSFKISPMDGGEVCYITVQCKDPEVEFSDHSFGIVWPNNIGAIAVVSFVVEVLAERGDLFRDIAMTMTDVLDFLA